MTETESVQGNRKDNQKQENDEKKYLRVKKDGESPSLPMIGWLRERQWTKAMLHMRTGPNWADSHWAKH